MDKIRLLSEDTINRIAAGEVVERPASVLKELVENSLDAGARRIECLLEQGGARLIRVTDDGEGMSAADAERSLERHATSKIRSADDLLAISTYGFRGEALSSIAAVSRLRLITRRSEDRAACEIQVEGGRVIKKAEVAAPSGTDIFVEDLFFNTPARRKFLRTSATELGQAQSWFEHLALGRPDVHMILRHGKRLLLEAPAARNLAERAATVLGLEVYRQLFPFEQQDAGRRIEGLLSSPELSRASARDITILINGRYVRDRLLQGAVLDACRGSLPDGRFPVAVLQLWLDPAEVDVNVHPQKVEVRFARPLEIRRLVERAVRDLLARAPWAVTSRVYRLAQPLATKAPAVSPTTFQNLPLAGHNHAKAVQIGTAQEAAQASTGLEDWQWLGSLWNTYLLFAYGQELVIIDQHAAAERITFEKLRAARQAGQIASQRLLIAETVELDRRRLAALESGREMISELGFELEPFGPTAVKINALPAELARAEPRALVEDLLDYLAEDRLHSGWEALEEGLLARLACHGSVRAGQRLGEEEGRALLKKLQEIDFGSSCPHGRPVAVHYSRAQIESWFHRR